MLAAGSASADTVDCPTSRVDEHVTVAYVYDGDTLRLQDGRKVRLIGINTPEIAHPRRASTTTDEPLARRARQTVQQLLRKTPEIRLRLGRQRHDRYQRLLAHVYLADGRNLEAILLQQGLAAQIVVPPNTYALECYRQAERVARQQRQGLWREDYFRPLDSEHLPAALKGFRFIQGRVSRVSHSRRSLWIELGQRFAVRIARKDLPLFRDNDPQQWLGKTIIVRGWVSRYRKKAMIHVRHPVSIETPT